MNSAHIYDLAQPVFARASAHGGARFRDEAAYHVLKRLELNKEGLVEVKPANANLSQAKWLDARASAFIGRHPEAGVVEIESGLSTRFHRLCANADWPRFSWRLVNNRDITDCLNFVFTETDSFDCHASEAPVSRWPALIGSQPNEALFVIAGESTPVKNSSIELLLLAFLEAIEQGHQRAELIICHHQASLADHIKLYSPLKIVEERTFKPSGDWFARLCGHWGRGQQQTTTLTYIKHQP